MSFKRNCTSIAHKNSTHPKAGATLCVLDARNHYPQIKHHTPPPKMEQQHASHPTQGPGKNGPVVSKPNSVFSSFITSDFPRRLNVCHMHPPETHYRSLTEISQPHCSHSRGGGGIKMVLLRKEVIQPHLPVRLPCYDFVPIADPTFDGSLPQGVRPPASGVTDFHDLTGGVYKPRERIHRSVADLRLLATPTSWGRVADPNPN